MGVMAVKTANDTDTANMKQVTAVITAADPPNGNARPRGGTAWTDRVPHKSKLWHRTQCVGTAPAGPGKSDGA